MNRFCNTPFWDYSSTWYTSTPLFTPCFQKAGLVGIPCLFFWIFLPVEIYLIAKSKNQKIPWTFLNLFKIAIALFMMAVVVTECAFSMMRYSDGEKVYPVEYYTPFVMFITLVAVVLCTAYERKKGVVSSGILFLFWFFFTLGTAVTFYNVLQKVFNPVFGFDENFDTDDFTLACIYFPLAFAEFVLFCFAEQKVKKPSIQDKVCPQETASFLSRITFWWFNPMAILGYKRPLSLDDMWDLSDDNRADVLETRFDKAWLPILHSFTGKIKKVKETLSRRYSRAASTLAYPVIPESVEHVQKDIEKLSILKPILKTFWLDLLVAGLLNAFACVITFVNPLILDLLIAFIGSNEPLWKGYLYAVSMFFAAMLESFATSQYEFRIYCVAMRIRSCVTNIVYKKALVLSSSGKKNFTVGEIVNLMSVDTQRVMDYVHFVNILWSAPLQIAISVYLLWQQLGIATLGGLAVLVLMVPLNLVVANFVKTFQFRLMTDKDQRTKLMNELLGGIKVLKLYAWELSFQKKVMGLRNKEIESLRMQAYLSGAITFAFTSAPFLVALASFATFVLMSPDNVLDANKAFVSLSLFNILRVPTAFLPMIIMYTAMFLVSLRRINKYMQSDELDPSVVGHNPLEKDPVVIEDGTFSWTKDDPPVLCDINFRVKEGSLVAVVGQVGSGKSSLLSALLGEMITISGRINVKGSVAYVPQQAWIQNATLQKNILFIKPFEEKKYNEVIEACALKPDLEILPGGDQTEIGEKGINLSGGQKQRVSLARAVYDDADIYYLDDPLSAVDAHVGKHIFEKVIGPKGMLKNKTRILVTHRITVLPDVDTIVVLKDGKVSETGSYSELLNKKGAFAEFLLEFLQQGVEEDTDIAPEELHLIEEIAATVGAPPELLRRISQMSGSESETEAHKTARALSMTASYISQSSTTRRRTLSRRDTALENLFKQTKSPSTKIPAAGTNLTEKEGVEVGSVKWWVYVEYIKSFGFWFSFWTVVGFAVSSAFSLGSNLWLSIWSNDSLDPSKATDTKLRDLRLGVYGGLGAGEVIFMLVASIVLNLACLQASKLLHDQMLNHVLHAPMSFFDTTPMGRVLNRFSKDMDTADVTIRFNIRMIFIQAFRAISSFIIISLETPVFLAAVLPLVVLYYFMQKLYIPTSRQLKRLESISRSPIYTHFSETVTGASCIRAYGARKQFVDQSNNLVDINNSSYFPSLGASRWLSIRLEFIGYCIVFLAALFAVLAQDTLSPGIAGLSVSYALQVTAILNILVRSAADVETNIVSVERCLEYTKTPTEAEWSNEGKKPKPSWPDQGQIIFDNYATRYREGLDLVLKGISCEFSSTERIGIVGRTGAGKSSLTLALFRIIEAAKGKIIIDGLNIGELGLHDLRSKLTIIPQDPVLFTGTLRMNLDPFDQYSDDEVWKALDLAHLKTFVSSVGKGLLHEVSEGGENLSVGQRQLACLARALLRKTKVLILDEATAAVDVETDELIQSTIRTAFSDCTVITIAHRLNTILDYDRVMVLSKGEIAELDSPEVLLQNEQSIFYSMAKDAGLV